MIACEFCKKEFIPKPQIKNPRACSRKQCQKLRQSSNERLWRQSNTHFNNNKYHNTRLSQRLGKATMINKALIKAFTTGIEFHGLPIDIDAFTIIFEERFSDLKVKELNKLWIENL